jgi:hypothetical protein
MSETLDEYLARRIRQKHAEGLNQYQIFEQLEAMTDSRKKLRQMIERFFASETTKGLQ